MRPKPHGHPCKTCKGNVECPGEWERNYDGFPEVICSFYHRIGGDVAEMECDDCKDKRRERGRKRRNDDRNV